MPTAARSFFMAIAAVVTFCTAISATLVATAQSLRIETQVYSGDESEPVSHAITLFDSGTVYDFVNEADEVAVFRPPTGARPGTFILLDLANRQRTEITTERIDALMDKLSKWAAEQDDPLLKFSAHPEFEESFDEETGLLQLTSSNWSYRVATVPADDIGVLAKYREFTDWYTRLNTMMHGAPPPGPRLKLNEALEKHGVVPVEIHRTVDTHGTSLRATHLFNWRLSRDDQQRLDEVRQHLANFSKVDNQAFIAARADRNLVRGQSK